jgi:fructose-1,6-bisphosphatase/inositol monophosphatase family enzyme
VREQLVRVAEAVRDDVLAACRAQTVEELAAYDDSGPGDTAFAVDRIGEERLLELVANLPVRLVAEGISAEQPDAEWTLLADPLDGTRPLAHQKRSAWVLLGATRGTSLADLEISVAVEVPTVKAAYADVLSAVRGEGVTAERVDLRSGSRTPLAVRPSRATGIEQGYGGIARYFPGARAELGDVDDAVHRRVLGPATTAGPPTCARCWATAPASARTRTTSPAGSSPPRPASSSPAWTAGRWTRRWT